MGLGVGKRKGGGGGGPICRRMLPVPVFKCTAPVEKRAANRSRCPNLISTMDKKRKQVFEVVRRTAAAAAFISLAL